MITNYDSPSIDLIMPKPKTTQKSSSEKSGCVKCGLGIISPGITREEIMNSPSYQMILPEQLKKPQKYDSISELYGNYNNRIADIGPRSKIEIFIPNIIEVWIREEQSEFKKCTIDLIKLYTQRKYFSILYEEIRILTEFGVHPGGSWDEKVFINSSTVSISLESYSSTFNSWEIFDKYLKDLFSQYLDQDPWIIEILVNISLELPCLDECCRRKAENINPDLNYPGDEIGKPIISQTWAIQLTNYPKLDSITYQYTLSPVFYLNSCYFDKNCGHVIKIPDTHDTGGGVKG